MPICHNHLQDDPFVRFHKKIVYDSRISWKAKGILSYAFSRPTDWEFFKSEIVQHSTDGMDSLESGLAELREFGYLHQKGSQNKETGKMEGVEWFWFDIPITSEEFSKKFSETPKIREPENPDAGKPPPTKNDLELRKTTHTTPSENPSTETEVVCVFLNKLNIPEDAKRDILKKHSLDEVEIAADRALKWETRKNDLAALLTCLQRSAQWCDEEHGGSKQENREFLDKIAHLDGKTFNGTRIVIGYNYIEFSGGMSCIQFKISDSGFIQTVQEQLKKFGIDRLALT